MNCCFPVIEYTVTMSPDIATSRTQLEKITVVLADDHPLLRQALRSLLEKQADFQIVAEADDGEATVKLVGELKPNVVIMDISMPKLNGLEATRQIKAKYPDVAVLVLTVHNDIEHILGILEAGADGYLTKSVFGAEVIQAIRSVVAGETVLSGQVLQHLLKHVLKYPSKSLPLEAGEKLTSRQMEILRLAARGMSNRDIAQTLNLSLRTVKGYMVEIFSKMKVNSRTEAVIAALRLGILTMKDLD